MTEPSLPLPPRWRRPRRLLLWFAFGIVILLCVAALAALGVARHLQPMVRSRLLQVFQERFRSPVSLDDLQVHYNGAIQVDGRGLRVQSVLNGVPGDPAHPMLRVQEFHFHMGLLAALSRSPRIHHVRIRGVQMDLPAVPAILQQHTVESGPTVDLEYAEVEDAHIRFASSAPDRAPFLFDLPHLALRGVSRSKPIRFHAVVDNGTPLGITETDGVIGPWNFDDPRQTPIEGQFHFRDKDLSSVRGLHGRLSLDGQYTGSVGSLHAEGTTDDPAFALDVSSHPVDLRTRFNVTLQPAQSTVTVQRLEGSFGKTAFVCSGDAVKDSAAQSFRWDFQLDAPAARVEDALALGTRTAPPLLRGALAVHGRFGMSAGPESVSRKLSSTQTPFVISDAVFNTSAMQQTFDGLAERAQGDPKNATPDRAAHSSANVQGKFTLQHAVIRFSTVHVIAPGSHSDLHGSYSLDGTQFDFDGVVSTEAQLSHMTTGIKRVLLKPFNHLLGHSRASGQGATLPVHIHGSGHNAHVDARVAGLWMKAPGTQ